MGRTKSKRLSLATKHHKIKKIKDAKKKMRKFAKQNPELLSNLKKKQDAGIPNLYPYKLALIEKTTNEKIEEREKKLRESQLKKASKETKKAAAAQQDALLKKDYELMHSAEGRRKWYFKELMKVVEASDVIIQVLDARDPMGCRALDIERKILAPPTKKGQSAKKLILLLNKVDMVPADNVAAWVTYLKREHPTLAFKSSTQKGRGHLQQIDVKLGQGKTSSIHSQSSVGASQLLQLLKNYSRNSSSSKTALTVGVIGYPNVGKSSVINSLKSQRVAQVSPSAGCTKALQFIKLDGTITLVDSPGVLFDADFDNTDMDDETIKQKQGLLLRNALRADQVEDPQEVVKAILSRITPEQLTQIYNIAAFKNMEEFLLFIAHRNGHLGKGGIPNLDDAARSIINDWNFGKIPFYSIPPVITDIQESTIVSGFSEGFDIDKLLNDSVQSVIKVFKNGELLPSKSTMGDSDDDDDIIDDDEDDDEDDYDEDDDYGMGDDSDDGLNDVPQLVSGTKKSTTMSMTTKTTPMTTKKSTIQKGYYQEESSDDEDTTMDNNTSYKLQQQQAYYKEQNKLKKSTPTPPTAQGKAKASTVLNKNYQAAGIQRAPTKAELKKLVKTRNRAEERARTANNNNNNDEDYDWNSLNQ